MLSSLRHELSSWDCLRRPRAPDGVSCTRAPPSPGRCFRCPTGDQRLVGALDPSVCRTGGDYVAIEMIFAIAFELHEIALRLPRQMADITHLLDAAMTGDRRAAAELLPLVYDELRNLAAARMAAERTGHTLDATGLVHEAYLRSRRPQDAKPFEGRRHFFAAAAEAMRRVLIDHARARRARKTQGRTPGEPRPRISYWVRARRKTCLRWMRR